MTETPKCYYQDCRREAWQPSAGETPFCIFHSPKIKEKRDDFAPAWESFLAEHRDENSHIRGLYCMGFVFPGDIGFRGATFSMDAFFGGATFSRDAFFRGATFSRDAHFGNATFSGNADFRDATFSGDAGFRGATFSGYAHFQGATFTGFAFFRGATFSGHAGFGNATFYRDADFGNATFSRDAIFWNATFSRDAGFRGATFSGNADFRNATFSGDADFRKVLFSDIVYFNEAKFSEITDFENATFSCVSVFEDAIFSGKVVFGKALFSELVSFKNTTFQKGGVFSNADFKGVDLTFSSFTNCSFYNVKYNTHNMVSFQTPLKWYKIREYWKVVPPTNFHGIETGGILAASNRRFVRDIEDQQFITQQKERSRLNRYFWIPVWYMTCDCGRSFSLFFLWCMLAAAIFGDIYLWFAEAWFPEPWKWSAITPFYYSLVTFSTLGFGDVSPRLSSGWAQFTVMVEVFIGYLGLGGLISIFANKLARRA